VRRLAKAAGFSIRLMARSAAAKAEAKQFYAFLIK
jgi:release factor glutamine methyltransferase